MLLGTEHRREGTVLHKAGSRAQRRFFGSALLPVSAPDGWRAVTAIGGLPVFSLCSYSDPVRLQEP